MNLINNDTKFTVSDFLNMYNHRDNTLKFEKLFNKNNVKKLIDVWLKSNQHIYPDITINYILSDRKWIIKKV